MQLPNLHTAPVKQLKLELFFRKDGFYCKNQKFVRHFIGLTHAQIF